MTGRNPIRPASFVWKKINNIAGVDIGREVQEIYGVASHADESLTVLQHYREQTVAHAAFARVIHLGGEPGRKAEGAFLDPQNVLYRNRIPGMVILGPYPPCPHVQSGTNHVYSVEYVTVPECYAAGPVLQSVTK